MKIYLAHPISNSYEAEESIKTANMFREIGFDVYVASENKSINDKTNNPTPLDIYKADCEQIHSCDIFVVNVTGGNQDGTIFEIGYASALNKNIMAYSTNTRLHNPQFYNGIPSAHANHLVVGGITAHGKDFKKLDALIEELKMIRNSEVIEDRKQVGGTHYNEKNDTINFSRDNFPAEHLEGFFRINVIKYVDRYDRKNGIEDLEKARDYLNLLIDLKKDKS